MTAATKERGVMFGAPYMPRWASRITLDITRVRAQRLHDISEADARAEGVKILVTTEDCPDGKARALTRIIPMSPFVGRSGSPLKLRKDELYRSEFAFLWDQINGKRAAWKENPFVWVISFRRICQCKSDLEDPGPTHLPSCAFADPNPKVAPW